MSVSPSAPVPAGWYPDPAGSFQQRWWDGTAWTNDFAQYRPTLIHSAPAAEALLARAAELDAVVRATEKQAVNLAGLTRSAESQPTQSPSPVQTLSREPADPLPSFNLPPEDRAPQTTVGQPNAGSAMLIPVSSPAPQRTLPDLAQSKGGDYLPFAAAPEVREGVRTYADAQHTASAWVLAAAPLGVFAAAWTVATYLRDAYTTFLVVGLAVVYLLASLTLAAFDRHSLSRAGHHQTASPGWVLLTPVGYLIARAVFVSRETGRIAVGPLALQLVVIGGIVAAFIAVPGLAALLGTASALY